MEIKYGLKYHHLVKNDIAKIDRENRNRIKKSLEQKLSIDPLTFSLPLRKSLKGYRKLRAGDYRIVLKVENKTVFILAIKHRSTIYKESQKRVE